MQIADLHPWDVSPAEARAIQENLRVHLRLEDRLRVEDIHRVAGVDNTYSRNEGGTTAYAVVVVLDFHSLEVLEIRYASRPVTFPYVPGLLAFREAPTVLDAFRQVGQEPDVVLFDGQGYAHPRRFGLASHLGVVLDLPSIGCAKSKLVGKCEQPAREFGAWTPLVDRGEIVGAAVRTRPSHAPLFVSAGAFVSLERGVEITLACCRQNRFMPEPTRIAHELITRYRQGPPNTVNP